MRVACLLAERAWKEPRSEPSADTSVSALKRGMAKKHIATIAHGAGARWVTVTGSSMPP